MLGFVMSQELWPGAGDVDDCWCLAGMQAIDAVAPWVRMVGVKAYREAAGKPDTPGVPNGGTEHDIAAGLRKLYPAIPVEIIDGGAWDTFIAKGRAGRPAALLGLSGALPVAYRFGFSGIHAVTVAFEGGEWLIANPLARPHSKPLPIPQSAIRAYVEGYQPKVHAVLMPTAADAFRRHPLYAEAIGHATLAATSAERTRATTIASEAIVTLGRIAQPT